MIDDCFLHDKNRLRHDEAIDILKSRLSAIVGTEEVPLEKATGRVLAQDIVAPSNIPMFNNSAVDGYAFSFDHHEGAGGFFPIISRIAAGDLGQIEISTNTAARIFTGAVMPEGADTVVMQEDCETHEQEGMKFVVIPQGLKKGANVRLAGEDVSEGEVVASTGTLLRPQDLAAIASCGVADVEVYKPLKIALASTGNEIMRPGEEMKTGQVYDANHFMISSLLDSPNIKITDLGILRDEREDIDEVLTKAAKTHDVILTSGGASMGSEDHITKLLEERGTRHMWQLAIKPGRPMCFGQLDDAMFFGLPGNPVASFVCFLLYIRPALQVLGGAQWREPRRFKIPSAIEFKNKKPDRREFWRGFIETAADGSMQLQKYDRDGSGLISGLRKAEGFIEIGESVTAINKGDMLDFIPFSEFGIE